MPTQIDDGSCSYYVFDDGHASVADDGSWISALFVSLDAAKSWRGHWDDAERQFLLINGGMPGENFLPARKV